MPIHQDAALFAAALTAGQEVTHRLEPGRKAYLVAAAGALTVNGEPAGARDGVTLSDVEEIVIAATEDSEILLADVA